MATIQYDDVSGAIEIKLKNGRTLSTGKFTMAEALGTVETAFRSGSFNEAEFNEASALMAPMSRTGGSGREAVDEEAWGANGRSGAAQETVTPPTITDAQVEVINNLIAQLKSRQVSFMGQDSVERQIRSILGLPDTAIGWAQAKQVYNTLVAPEIVDVPIAETGVPVPDIGAVTAPEGVNIPAREEFFLGQGSEDIRRRLIANQFRGGLTPTGQRAAENVFSRFASTAPLTNFGATAVPLANAFQSFVGGPRPTQAGLQGQLTNILGGADPATIGTPEATAGDLFFQQAFPTAGAAFGAGIQPFLAGITPRVAGGIGDILTKQFETQVAQTPEQFATQRQLLENVFGDLRSRGFIQ
jgi:hypothetical protein